MATAASLPIPPPEPTSVQATPDSVTIRAHNPIPLNAAQEGQVRDIYYKRVRSYCADEIRDFAHCATGRTFSVTWACRSQRLAMNTCMNGHATREEEDAAREEWFASVGDRRREREEKERTKEREKKKHHDWWELDENGRRVMKSGQPPQETR